MRKFCLTFFLCLTLVSPAYSESSSVHQNQSLTPVILIPGTTRTKLSKGKNGRIVWGNFRNFFGVRHGDGLALPIDSTSLRENRDNLVPRGLVENFTIIPFIFKVYTHKKFLERMQRIGGYKLGDMDQPKPGDNFFIFLYDWRRSNEENAEQLAKKVESLKQFYGREDIRFDFIVHSSALYMVRYYALYSGKDILSETNPTPTNEGAQNIQKLVLISPPHRGTALSFRIIHEGYRPVRLPFARFFSTFEIFTLPAFFEMLPPPGEKLFVDEHGNILDIDLYDAANWVQHGWSVFSPKEQKRLEKKMKKRFRSSWREEMTKENEKRLRYLEAVLKRAKALHQAIDEGTKNIDPSVETYSFIFLAGPTLERIEFSQKDGRLRFKKGDAKPVCFSPGDLIVTNASMHGRYQEGHKPKEIFIHESHRRMANSRELHLQLIQLVSEKSEV